MLEYKEDRMTGRYRCGSWYVNTKTFYSHQTFIENKYVPSVGWWGYQTQNPSLSISQLGGMCEGAKSRKHLFLRVDGMKGDEEKTQNALAWIQIFTTTILAPLNQTNTTLRCSIMRRVRVTIWTFIMSGSQEDFCMKWDTEQPNKYTWMEGEQTSAKDSWWKVDNVN